ncbi:hypothetical protein FE257_000929 [Aspergillus nanangensis]|uniref:GPI anchored protein n=1 Tax=Aspergillus nanangensis TaxID=2582783 RepID=A0AAD4GR14_ASPNN|nr:hypothetical protein FE257_000929 [Aspergillus nanangensis]
MRVHQLLALSGLMLLSNVAIGAKLDHDDVPDRCWNVCGSLVGKAKQCDSMHDDDDRAEIQCICDWNQASSIIPLCEACIADYRNQDGGDDDDDDNGCDNSGNRDCDDRDDRDGIHDNEAYEILGSCTLTATSYNPAAATSAMSSTSTSPAATGATTTSGPDAQATDNAAHAASIPKAAPLAAVMGLGVLAYL